MKVVIVGAGAVGLQLAKQLVEEKKDVVLIEQDSERARLASNRLDCLVVNRPGNSLEALREAGVESAEYFIAVTDSDEVNMIACVLVASEFDVPHKIARVRNIDYSSSRVAEHGTIGIDYVVNPEIVAAQAIIRTIEHGAISDIMLFEQSTVQMRHLTVDSGSVFSNRSLAEFASTSDIPFLVAAVLRDNHYLVPSGQTVIQPGDILYVVATEKNFNKLYALTGRRKTGIRKVVIVGGGKIGSMVAAYLMEGKHRPAGLFRRLVESFGEERRRSVKIIDRDYERCKALSRQLPGALVIHADISDEGVIEEEHFENSDLVIAVTSNQELNIVSAVYAKKLGITRSIALVNKTTYTRIATQLGIDVPVSLKNSMVNTILKYIRRGNIKNVHSISEGAVEVIEVSVDGRSIAVGKRIRDLRLPAGSLVVSVLREEDSFVPDGSYVLQADDHIIVISRIETIEKIQEVFTAVR